MLELSNVNSYYGRSQALHDLSVSTNKGEMLAILGRNGVGKTTLLKTILGLTDRSEGEIRVGGQDISNLATFARARAGIGYVPQGRMIIPDFSVRDNILMGGFAAEGVRKIPEIVPDLFPYLMENLDRPGGLLSGGQQQQLAIARALTSNPQVLLMDEPTEGIQPNIVQQIEDNIIQLNRELGLTILLVEQNVNFSRRAAQAFAMVEHGTVVEGGPIQELTDDIVTKHMTI